MCSMSTETKTYFFTTASSDRTELESKEGNTTAESPLGPGQEGAPKGTLVIV